MLNNSRTLFTIKEVKNLKKKKVTKIIIILCSFILMFIILHSTPRIALRTHLFMTGHPIVTFNTGIVDDKLHNRLNEQDTVPNKNISFYTTQSESSNYKVTKIGLLFFAIQFGEA